MKQLPEKRSPLLLCLCALLILAALLIGGVLLVISNRPTPVLVEMGQPILLNHQHDKESKTLLFSYYAGLDLEHGSVRSTVEGATLYPNLDAAGIDWADLSSAEADSHGQTPFLLLDIYLENLDAQPTCGTFNAHYPLYPAQAFTGWSVIGDSPFLPIEPVYFSDHADADQETPGDSSFTSPYFHFTLSPGSSRRFQVGYFLQDTDQHYILNYGTSGTSRKYGAILDY